MKKKIILSLLIILPFSLLFFTNNAKADIDTYIYFWYYKTENQEYYTDETIIINASWSFNYAPTEVIYVRFEILNETENILWNSEWYNEKYPYPSRFNVTHYVPIRDLYIPLNISEYVLHVKLRWVEQYGDDYVADVPITILKRNCTCELSNFRDNIDINTATNGFDFTARFYNETKILANQLIYVSINNNFTTKLTNSTGFISLKLRIPDNLTIGANILLLEIKNDWFIHESKFQYYIIVSQNSYIINNDGNSKEKKEDDPAIQFNILSFCLILGIVSSSSSVIFYNNKKKKKVNKIGDITFRN